MRSCLGQSVAGGALDSTRLAVLAGVEIPPARQAFEFVVRDAAPALEAVPVRAGGIVNAEVVAVAAVVGEFPVALLAPVEFGPSLHTVTQPPRDQPIQIGAEAEDHQVRRL